MVAIVAEDRALIAARSDVDSGISDAHCSCHGTMIPRDCKNSEESILVDKRPQKLLGMESRLPIVESTHRARCKTTIEALALLLPREVTQYGDLEAPPGLSLARAPGREADARVCDPLALKTVSRRSRSPTRARTAFVTSIKPA